MAKREKTGGGSRKGRPNKTNAEIREIIDRVADMDEVVAGLVRLASGPRPNPKAAQILLEYRYGKPRESVDVTSGGRTIGFNLGTVVQDAFGVPQNVSLSVSAGVAEGQIESQSVC